MTRWEHYIDRAENIIKQYDGTTPLHRFLKDLFRHNPKMGSTDRKQVSQLTYGYFRFGKATGFPDIRSRILTGIWLFSSQEAYLNLLPDLFQQNNSLSLPEKILKVEELYEGFSPIDIFPWTDLLSPKINSKALSLSFLIQPALFLRIRNPKQAKIEEKSKKVFPGGDNLHEPIKVQIEQILTQNKISFQWMNENCLRLPNGTKAEMLLSPDCFEIQDYSSQKTASLFKPGINESWWDCCAASGGKSLLLKDIEPSVNLTVSDIRSSILDNLSIRFQKAGHTIHHSLVIDLMQEKLPDQIAGGPFDGILVDAPCSGSGTWSRTPENLYFFSPDNLTFFHERQLRIAQNVIRFLKPGGTLIYITCSVFQQENEQVIDQLLHSAPLSLEQMETLDGTKGQADSMFIARLRKE